MDASIRIPTIFFWISTEGINGYNLNFKCEFAKEIKKLIILIVFDNDFGRK